MKKTKDIIIICFIVLCFVVSLICGISSYIQYREYSAGLDEYENLDANVKSDDSTIVEDDSPSLESSFDEMNEIIVEPAMMTYPKLDIDFESYKLINSDFVGLIYVPVLDIRYPIVKSKDNNEYLSLTFEKKRNSSGCIFMDTYSASDFSDTNTFIFGHNMKNKSMFGCLRRFRSEPELCDKDPYIYIYTEDGVYKYHIFAYYLTTPDSITYKDIVTIDDYANYVKCALTSSEYSQYDSSTDEFEYYPKLLTLSTCSGSNHTHYMIVNAVCVGKSK